VALIDLLMAGNVDAFNQTRGDRGELDLFAADLAEKELHGVDLSSANLEKADLTGADLTGASLIKSRLAGIDGAGLILREALAARAKLSDAWLEDAVLDDAELTQADFKEANLKRSSAERARFVGARLVQADLSEAKWGRAELAEASLHKAVAVGADLGGADLTDTNLTSADLTKARLDGVVGPRARFMGAKLVEAVLVAARLEEANLSGADLTGADLSGADLTRANLAGCVLTGATLRGAVLAGAVLDGVDLSGLDLEDVDLSGVDPSAIGLSDDQKGQVSGVGVQAASNAPVKVASPSVARSGDRVLCLWVNDDGDEQKSIRYAVAHGEGSKVHALPISADGLVGVSAAGLDAGFVLVALQTRPGGVYAVTYDVGLDGEIARSRSFPLGYDPAFAPVARASGDAVMLFGIARTGPTLVVQRLDAAGLALAHSQKVPTARGFVGRHLPVLACKGDVWMPVGVAGAGAPLASAPGFPGVKGAAAPLGDGVVAVFATAPTPKKPGTLQIARVGKRGAPDVRTLAVVGAVVALDLLVVGEDVFVAWVDETGVRRLQVGRDPVEIKPDTAAKDVWLCPAGLATAGAPVVAVVSPRGSFSTWTERGFLGRVGI
jgi:uncharacterized protein YjbI with pentapeptide repeats